MENTFILSKKEEEVMQLFWEAGQPLGRIDLLEMAAQRECSWKPNSIHILLNQLLEKNAICVAGFYQESRRLGRSFEPTVTKEDYYTMQVAVAAGEALQCGVAPEDLERAVELAQKEFQRT